MGRSLASLPIYHLRPQASRPAAWAAVASALLRAKVSFEASFLLASKLLERIMPHIKRGTRASQVSIVTESKGLLGFGRNWARKGPTRIGRMQSTWVQRQLMLESPGCIQTHSWDPRVSNHALHTLALSPRNAPYQYNLLTLVTA